MHVLDAWVGVGTSLVNRGLGLPHQALSERKGRLNKFTVRRRYRLTREKRANYSNHALFFAELGCGLTINMPLTLFIICCTDM